LKAIGKHHKLSLVKEAENAKDVAALLHPNFIKPIRVLKVFEILFRNFVDFFNSIKRPDDFLFHLVTLLYEELLEIALIKNNGSALLLLATKQSYKNVALK
jgi:hypothetical protein